MELKLVPTGIKNQHKKLGIEALNIVEDSIQDMCTCARNLGCNSTQDCYVYLCNGLCWTFLINLFCYILCKFVWIFCVAQVEGAALRLPRANSASCLYCAQDKFLQRPINLSYLILSYLSWNPPQYSTMLFVAISEYNGSRCEIEQDDCPVPGNGEEPPCLNEGQCQDLVQDYICVCPLNNEFFGDR